MNTPTDNFILELMMKTEGTPTTERQLEIYENEKKNKEENYPSNSNVDLYSLLCGYLHTLYYMGFIA